MTGLNKTFYSVAVKETDTTRRMLQELPWVSNSTGLRQADIVLLPWHSLEGMEEPTFPQGTADLFKFLQKAGLGNVALPVLDGDYIEIAMHGKAWRLPTFLLTGVVLPIFVSVVADQISNMLPGIQPNDTVHLELVVERPTAPCVSIKYEGPASRLPETLIKESEACLEKTPIPAKAR